MPIAEIDSWPAAFAIVAVLLFFAFVVWIGRDS